MLMKKCPFNLTEATSDFPKESDVFVNVYKQLYIAVKSKM